MKRLILLIILSIMIPAVSHAEEIWLKFELMQGPFYNQNGNIIDDPLKRITYSKNSRKITYGGEWLLPDFEDYKIVERHQRENLLIILFDITEQEADILKNKDEEIVFVVTYKIRSKRKAKPEIISKHKNTYNFKDFKIKTVSDKKAEELLKEWGVFEEIFEPESGVTN